MIHRRGVVRSRAFAALYVLVSLVGCAAYKPVPDGYTGPTATLADTGFAEDGSKAQLFVVLAIDGNRIVNSFDASAQASSGQGFRLNTRLVQRQVPARPMKVLLRGSHTTGAPIQAIFSQVRGTFFSVEGTVEFTPEADHAYAVRGDLKKEGSSVWIEDVVGDRPVTEKVFGK